MGFKNNMIDRKLILANAPSATGEQIHVNHTGCEAGEDIKRRLYIKRTETGLVAYCHHCNESGFVSDGSGRLSTWINKKESSAASNNEKPVLASLSLEGKLWLHKYYCDTSNKVFSGVAGERHKVALTLHNPEQQPIGWQVRNVAPNATPKYISHYIDSNSRGDASWFHKNSKTLVISEDYLSAYRVHNDTGFSSVALLRTIVLDKTLRQIDELEFEYVVIWLDPDEAGIEGATKAYKKLNHFLPSKTKLVLLGIDKEPKQCRPEELDRILT